MTDKSKALADIESVLRTTPASFGGSAGPTVQMSALYYSCIVRWTPSGSSLRQQASGWAEHSTNVQHVVRSSAEIALRGILEALKEDIAADRIVTFEELVHADLFADLLAQAAYLNHERYTRAAAVLGGGVLEEHLRKLCDKHSISTTAPDGKPKKASALNTELYKPGNAYSNAERGEIESWQNRRNSAAHGDVDFEKKHDQTDIRRMIEGIQSFIVKYPA